MNLKKILPNERDQLGMVIAAVVMLIYYAFTPYYDEGFAGTYVQAYGRLWYILNPFFQIPWMTAITTMFVYFAILLPQIWLVKKGRLDKKLVYLNIFSAVMFMVLHAQQDITVIAFAPLATINPIFIVLFILQKFAFGWSWDFSDGHWYNMTHQLGDCASGRVPCQNIMVYWLLIFWLVLPVAIWVRKRLK